MALHLIGCCVVISRFPAQATIPELKTQSSPRGLHAETNYCSLTHSHTETHFDALKI